MKNNQKVQKPGRGGARPGSGRKPGTTNKISAQAIIDSLEHHLGVSYADQLALNYLDALAHHDRTLRASYDRLFLGKIVADKIEVDTNETADSIAAKRQAFAEAIAQIAGIKQPD